MKNQGLKILFLIAAMIGSMQLIGCSKDTAEDYTVTADESAAIIEKIAAEAILVDSCINALLVEPLSEAEIDALNTMREEELLAKDVYVALYALYNVPVFNNISKSETQHASAVGSLIVKYGLPDPALNHVAGVFVNADLQALYTSLVAQGSTSLISAFTVGATIEDLDINDLQNHIATDVDNQDILFVFGNLDRGSRNHMRAFNRQLKAQGVTYTPQFISQEFFDQIISTPNETGTGVCPN
ncbi:MAG: DUF2202 domain-containing protein [Bacteroidales bacterium]|nr:DUF2202 domain-containing protein [Bacteroidales bacterium]